MFLPLCPPHIHTPPLSRSFSLSFYCLSVSMFVSLSESVSFSFFIAFSLLPDLFGSVSVSVCLSLSISLSPPLFLCCCLSVYLHVSASLSRNLYLSICLYHILSQCFSNLGSLPLSVPHFVCFFFHPSLNNVFIFILSIIGSILSLRCFHSLPQWSVSKPTASCGCVQKSTFLQLDYLIVKPLCIYSSPKSLTHHPIGCSIYNASRNRIEFLRNGFSFIFSCKVQQ